MIKWVVTPPTEPCRCTAVSRSRWGYSRVRIPWKIVLLDEAQRRFEAEDRWWRENRDAKELFFTDFRD
jgi:hypothetical protein